MLACGEEEREKGVVTSSSGNFAAAFAFSASLVGLEPLIVVPSNASEIKVSAMLRNGGKKL